MSAIIFYTPFLKIGGIEKVTIEYLKLLIEQGNKVELFVDYDMGGQNFLLSQVPKDVNVTFIKGKVLSRFIYSLRTISKSKPYLSPFLFASVILSDFFIYHFKIKPLMKSMDFCATITFYQFLPAYITKFKNAKHFIWLHGSVEHFFDGSKRYFKRQYLKKLERYDKVVTIADEMAEQLKKFYPSFDRSKIERIYNPLDFSVIKNLSLDFSELSSFEFDLIRQPYLCHVSRIDENQKDITTLILAFDKLQRDENFIHNLIIVGTGPDLDRLNLLTNQLGLSGRVFFVGNKINPYVWMKHADILVLSSKFEGFGLVLVEAMSLNTFVISSTCKTGPGEILGNGLYGDLFPVGDSAALSDLIGHALLDVSYRDRKVLLAAERITEFDRIQTGQQMARMLPCGRSSYE